MSPVPTHFCIPRQPAADEKAVLVAGQARFTVLTSRLIRLEYDPHGRFQDAASQTFWFRHQPVPAFESSEKDGRLHIQTAHLHLSYQTGQPFTPDSLTITLLENEMTWHYGDTDPNNLRGTYRTLDTISGSTPLEPGLMSRSGWAVVDDSHTLVFREDGWLEPRPGQAMDMYFFGYGRDYRTCLQDYSKVTGAVPLLPRWALGNWWSRYWAYTQSELTRLMEEFRTHKIPLAVCIVDMDWHLTDVGEASGWTGYTWNRDLFPEPDAFVGWLHELGLKTALNLHPALGVRPHEEQYAAMARRLGLDPAANQPIDFNIADPAFTNAYFELLHHPMEKMGVDFWWMDWQQGTLSELPGLDPLWWLNHLHFYDLGRNGYKRPFVFSRWGGLGNHRYPIGFSGDTWVNWESLAFQPYFTATAANVGYGWWSHDIGGHFFGVEESELYARWVQFGVFSPILRLHSTKNPFHERRPWAYDAETYHVTKDAMQLRHTLIPYLYTQSWHNHTEHIPPFRPLYHDYPDEEAAYHCPQQYAFGSELIAAPFVEPADADTRLSRQVVWLPPGDWYHFFSGEYVPGSNWHAQYGSLADIPVFAPAGAIVPLGPTVGWGGVGNPVELTLRVFAGADGHFRLYEDDGETTAYQSGDYSLTDIRQTWRGKEMEITVTAVPGHQTHIPDFRSFRLHIYGIRYPLYVALMVDDSPVSCHLRHNAHAETVHIGGVNLPKASQLTVTIGTDEPTLLARRDRTGEKVMAMLHAFKLESQAKMGISQRWQEVVENPLILNEFAPVLAPSQARALIEVTQQAGLHHIRNTFTPDLLLLWNNRHNPALRYQYNLYDPHHFWLEKRFQSEAGIVPTFQALTPKLKWQMRLDYAGVTAVTLAS